MSTRQEKDNEFRDWLFGMFYECLEDKMHPPKYHIDPRHRKLFWRDMFDMAYGLRDLDIKWSGYVDIAKVFLNAYHATREMKIEQQRALEMSFVPARTF